MNRVLLFAYPRNIGKFSLHCSKPLIYWVSYAILLNVQDIELSFERNLRVKMPESKSTRPKHSTGISLSSFLFLEFVFQVARFFILY